MFIIYSPIDFSGKKKKKSRICDKHLSFCFSVSLFVLYIFSIFSSTTLLSGKYSWDICFECFYLTLADVVISRAYTDLQVYRPGVRVLKDMAITTSL